MNLSDAEAANRALQPDALAGVARAWGFETVSPLRRLGGYSSLNLLVSADQRQLVLKRTTQAQEVPIARADYQTYAPSPSSAFRTCSGSRAITAR